jgi:iron complex transport system ATP-binding protein
MIEIENVSHFEGRAQILHDVSLTLPSGGVTALIGPNGAGKSTLLSLIARLRPLGSGRIAIDGMDVTRTPTETLALRLAILRQEGIADARLRVRDLVGFGRFPHHRGRPGPADRAAVDQAMARLDLAPLADRFIDALSGGQRQRALVAMVFAQGADHVLLDEPLNNLDMRHARLLMRLLRQAADQDGRTIVTVLHDINHAAAHADRIVALKDGRLFAQGPPDAVVTAQVLSDLYDMPIDVRRIDGRQVALHHA